jgi:hypothetical protein
MTPRKVHRYQATTDNEVKSPWFEGLSFIKGNYYGVMRAMDRGNKPDPDIMVVAGKFKVTKTGEIIEKKPFVDVHICKQNLKSDPIP